MMKAEDRLLETAFETGSARHNKQKFSNANEESGFVYAVHGRVLND